MRLFNTFNTLLLVGTSLFAVGVRADYLYSNVYTMGTARLEIVGGTPGAVVEELYDILGKAGYPAAPAHDEPSCLGRSVHFYNSETALFLSASASQGCTKITPSGVVAVDYSRPWDWVRTVTTPDGRFVVYGVPGIGSMHFFNLLAQAGFSKVPISEKAIRVSSRSVNCFLDDKNKPGDQYQYYCQVTVPVK